MLPQDNRAMRRLIDARKPKPLTELAEMNGRHVSNLSRTLRMMKACGLAATGKERRATLPIALAAEFLVVPD